MISTSIEAMILAIAARNSAPWYPPSAYSLRRKGYNPNKAGVEESDPAVPRARESVEGGLRVQGSKRFPTSARLSPVRAATNDVFPLPVLPRS